MGSSSDSGDDDDAAGLQAQVAQMMGPINSRVKKCAKKIDKLETLVDSLRRVESEAMPEVRKELSKNNADQSSRLERLQSEVAQLASKTQLEVLREESNASEARLRGQLDEERSKAAAQSLQVQSLVGRLDTMERAMRASELKAGGELAAAVSQLAQLTAALERQRGETEAKVGEVSSRMSTQNDALLIRLAACEEENRQLKESLATKTELAALTATVNRKAGESETSSSANQQQWKSCHEAIESVRTSLARDYAPVTSVESVERRLETSSGEIRKLVSQLQAGGEQGRAQWEDKLLQRQLGLETAAQEARRDWHRLSAQLETVQTYVTERALRSEHDELKKSVELLTSAAATKEELEVVDGVAKAAAKGSDFQVLEAEVRSLASAAKAEAASSAERFSRAADAVAFGTLEETVRSMLLQVESKMGTQEAQFALSNKLEKGTGEALSSEVEAMQGRCTALNERANEADLAVSQANSALERAQAQVEEVQSQLAQLMSEVEGSANEGRARASDVHDLIKAVRALTADAEMRCALDEREMEFLWAAPSHIYGSHGWRDNNGSQSERTPYPVGNFKMKQQQGAPYKMAVRHGTEGNAKDVLNQRKKWLNSITVGKRAALEQENAAIQAGGAIVGAPVRLPALDEYAKFQQQRGARPATGEGGVLQPAHELLGAYPATVGGGVGLRETQRAYAGHHRRVVEGGTM